MLYTYHGCREHRRVVGKDGEGEEADDEVGESGVGRGRNCLLKGIISLEEDLVRHQGQAVQQLEVGVGETTVEPSR